MVSCTGTEADDGSTVLMERPYMAEIRELLYRDGECITQAENERRARELLGEAEFRNALKQIINRHTGQVEPETVCESLMLTEEAQFLCEGS